MNISLLIFLITISVFIVSMSWALCFYKQKLNASMRKGATLIIILIFSLSIGLYHYHSDINKLNRYYLLKGFDVKFNKMKPSISNRLKSKGIKQVSSEPDLKELHDLSLNCPDCSVKLSEFYSGHKQPLLAVYYAKQAYNLISNESDIALFYMNSLFNFNTAVVIKLEPNTLSILDSIIDSSEDAVAKSTALNLKALYYYNEKNYAKAYSLWNEVLELDITDTDKDAVRAIMKQAKQKLESEKL